MRSGDQRGAVLRAAELTEGSSVAVWGVGGVGLNAVAAARMTGAYLIVAVDVDDAKLELAGKFGATHVVNALGGDPTVAVRELTLAPDEGHGFRGKPIAGCLDTVGNAVTVTNRQETSLGGYDALRADLVLGEAECGPSPDCLDHAPL